MVSKKGTPGANGGSVEKRVLLGCKAVSIIIAAAVAAFGIWLIKEVAWYLFWAPGNLAGAMTLDVHGDASTVWLHGMVLGVTALLVGFFLVLAALAAIARILQADEMRQLQDERLDKLDSRMGSYDRRMDDMVDKVEALDGRLNGRP